MYVCQWQKNNGILVADADGMSSFSALSFPITSKVLNWKPCEEEEKTVQTSFPGTTRNAVSQSVSQETTTTTKEDEVLRERERERERELFFTFSCAHRLASPCAQTPGESSSSPLPQSATSRC